MKYKYFLSALIAFLPVLIQEACSQETQSQKNQNPAIFNKFNKSVFGPNVLVFEPSMNMREIQTVLDTIFARLTVRRSEFSKNRYAMLFKQGEYDLDVRVEYYMEVLGLGISPEDVIIKGAVRSNTTHGNSVLTNFWRSVGNMTIVPKDTTMVWGVSQAAPLRRVHIRGNLQLFDKGYASGGFLADSKVDGTITSGPQQQWLTRNSDMGKWVGGNWNMMFIGVPQAPEENWPEKPYTTIEKTPVVREKPFLAFDKKGYSVIIPAIKQNSTGTEWIDGFKPEKSIPLSKFYLANAETDNSKTINEALKRGKHLFFTPGRYFLDESLKVTRPGTVVMGIGLATLIPTRGNSVMDISDVDGIILSGLTIDAGSVFSKKLMVVGEPGSVKVHAKNPVFMYDIFFRVGGPAEGAAQMCLEINSNDVIIDHTWIWRADHGNGVGWNKNRCANGLVVNGNNVTIYGLFNEHFQEYQTLWNGNGGKVYFYQSEMPYDPPTAEAWTHNGVNGYASYKVSDHVTSHEAWGLGIYNVFYDAPVVVDNAIEAPAALEDKFHHLIIFWLNGNKESYVKSIINGKGNRIDINNRKSTLK